MFVYFIDISGEMYLWAARRDLPSYLFSLDLSLSNDSWCVRSNIRIKSHLFEFSIFYENHLKQKSKITL